MNPDLTDRGRRAAPGVETAWGVGSIREDQSRKEATA